MGENKSGVFTGVLSGDYECWCLDVTEEEYRRVVGEEYYQRELESFKEDNYTPSVWRLYPNDLFRFLGVNDDKKVRFRMEILEETPKKPEQ